MKQYDLIQVLWVEDDISIINNFINDAFYSGLELVPYCCWDDAKEALENDYDRWSAIILDGLCKRHKQSVDNAVEFLGEALIDISVLAEKRGRIIPWYVLTGGAPEQVSDSIRDERLKWDKEWTASSGRKYYSKNTDTEILYSRIKNVAQESSRLQIQKIHHSVFEAIEECNIDKEATRILENLLIPLHFPSDQLSTNYNKQFNEARKCLEYIFKSMSCFGILPNWGGEVNINWSCCILGGQDCKMKNNNNLIVKNNNTNWRKSFHAQLFWNLATTLNSASHPGFERYLKSVNNSTYLLKSIALQLCDAILWYHNYLRDHSNIEENSQNWQVIDESQLKRR